MSGDGPVIPRLYLGSSDEAGPDLVVFDGPAGHGAAGIVLVTEPGRALSADDVTAVTGLPIIAIAPFRADIARAVDAGILADRLPDTLRSAARPILAVLNEAGKEVAEATWRAGAAPDTGTV